MSSLTSSIKGVTPVDVPTPTPPPHLLIESVKDYSGLITAGVALIGVAGAAIATVFLKRTYANRLEPLISASVIERGRHRDIAVSVKVKNVGASRVTFEEGCVAFEIHAAQIPSGKISNVHARQWELLSTHPILQEHSKIESGETIDDKNAIMVPYVKSVDYKVVLKIWNSGRMSSTLWTATELVSLPEQDNT